VWKLLQALVNGQKGEMGLTGLEAVVARLSAVLLSTPEVVSSSTGGGGGTIFFHRALAAKSCTLAAFSYMDNDPRRQE